MHNPVISVSKLNQVRHQQAGTPSQQISFFGQHPTPFQSTTTCCNPIYSRYQPQEHQRIGNLRLRSKQTFPCDRRACHKKLPTLNPMTVTIQDGSQDQSTRTSNRNISLLPGKARLGHIIPGLATYSLISVMKLCNTGCEVSLTKFGIGVEVRYRQRVVLTGSKCRPLDGTTHIILVINRIYYRHFNS